MEGACREASHAGSWYTGNQTKLDSELSGWLSDAETSQGRARAIIAPHAGYSYSGPTAAWAYKHINPEGIERVFLLGPSHHVYLSKCALSACNSYATPIGDITIDKPIYKELADNHEGKFMRMNKDVDEDEHSLEMHLPYIRKIFEGKDITLVPVMVGNLSENAEKEYGQIFAPYLEDERNLFVISSDFCHWGKNFDYTPYDKTKGNVSEYISHLDHQGMDLIESQDSKGFHKYLSKTDNTICGRHPIAILLNAIKSSTAKTYNSKFVKYAQSSEIKSSRDSSVSYASCVTVFEE